MTITSVSEMSVMALPDHTQLPESDGTFVKNFQEHPQGILLTDSIRPKLQDLHPEGNYRIGQDSGIYWDITEPPEKGAEAPDWFYIANVTPLLEGEYRRSYVMWKESIPPVIAIEFVSGNGKEERDKTPPKQLDKKGQEKKAGKFWVYEQAICIPYYAIYEVKKASVEVYQLREGRYQLLKSNERGHYPIAPMGVELGIWPGRYDESNLPWLRWWDNQGNLLLTGEERSNLLELRLEREKRNTEQERLRAEQEHSRAEQERSRAEKLAEKLREMGINPDDI